MPKRKVWDSNSSKKASQDNKNKYWGNQQENFNKI